MMANETVLEDLQEKAHGSTVSMWLSRAIMIVLAVSLLVEYRWFHRPLRGLTVRPEVRNVPRKFMYRGFLSVSLYSVSSSASTWVDC